MTRDYCAEMRRIIDARTADGRPYIARVVASEVVTDLRTTDPDLLNGWLNTMAEHFIWQFVNDRDRAIRSRARYYVPRDEFQQAARAFTTGNDKPLRRFMDMPLTVADGTRKRLAILNHNDLMFVAADYDKRAATNAMMTAFLTALAKKVGDGVVADHFTEEKLAELFNSLRKST